MEKPKVVAIVGPTASGKTSLSIEVARRFAGEIVSVDSRQVYKKLDIGTGKVTKEEMDDVTHHLLDVVNVKDTYTVTNFTYDAELAINRILKRNHLPVLAGGTFFYLDQLRGIGAVPAVSPNPKLREKLEKLSTNELSSMLKEKDPDRAGSIDLSNRRRVVRALEIIEELGKVPDLPHKDSPYEWLIIGIKIDDQKLMRKFEKRANSWLKRGLLNEVEWLQKKVTEEKFKEFGFEYALAKDLMEKKIIEEQFIQKFKEKNRQYAKRQMTWLKRDNKIKWFETTDKNKIFKAIENFINK